MFNRKEHHLVIMNICSNVITYSGMDTIKVTCSNVIKLQHFTGNKRGNFRSPNNIKQKYYVAKR
jgi:hypothetical protein